MTRKTMVKYPVHLLFWFGIIMSQWSCSLSDQKIKEVTDFSTDFDESATDVSLMKTENGKIEMILRSPLLQRKIQNGRIVDYFPDGLELEFYNPEGELQASLTSNYAERIETDGVIFARDSVIILNNAGDKLTTTQIVWSDKENTLENNQYVILTNSETNDTIVGFGINANRDFSNFEIKNRFSSLSKMEKITKDIKRNP